MTAARLFYLGRHVYCGVIREQEISAYSDGQVTFHYSASFLP